MPELIKRAEAMRRFDIANTTWARAVRDGEIKEAEPGLFDVEDIKAWKDAKAAGTRRLPTAGDLELSWQDLASRRDNRVASLLHVRDGDKAAQVAVLTRGFALEAVLFGKAAAHMPPALPFVVGFDCAEDRDQSEPAVRAACEEWILSRRPLDLFAVANLLAATKATSWELIPPTPTALPRAPGDMGPIGVGF